MKNKAKKFQVTDTKKRRKRHVSFSGLKNKITDRKLRWQQHRVKTHSSLVQQLLLRDLVESFIWFPLLLFAKLHLNLVTASFFVHRLSAKRDGMDSKLCRNLKPLLIGESFNKRLAELCFFQRRRKKWILSHPTIRGLKKTKKLKKSFFWA